MRTSSRARANPGQELLHQLLLVHVRRRLHVAQWEALYVDEELGLVSQVVTLLTQAEP